MPGSPNSLRPVETNVSRHGGGGATSSIYSSSKAREEILRPSDDVELARAEMMARKQSVAGKGGHGILAMPGERSETPTDELDDRTNPVHNVRKAWKPPKEPTTGTAKFFKRIHESSVFVRYFTYIVPVALILLIPLLLGALMFTHADVGGVELTWFMVWLEVVWLSLWAGRVVAKFIPQIVNIIASILTNGSKKWRDMATMLEIPVTLFFWWLSIYVSFLPIMRNNHRSGNTATQDWEHNLNIVILCLFIASILNLVQKILVQLLAISFHIRTYSDRIEISKFQITSLAKLYKHAKDLERDMMDETRPLGAMTPKAVLTQGAQRVANRLGDVIGKIAGDFTGRQINSSTSPQQVVLTLLQTTEGSNVLARRLYRAFVRAEEENVHDTDLRAVFADDDEAEAAFSMFDRDMNGDISCEEMELACVEIGRERKAISASLKDLDSVVSKFDDCLTFVVVIIVIMVFLSLISRSTAGALTSASSSILALSWLFSATAQEFLASLVFVFVKHPFDVGDRVEIRNTGAGTAESFYIREIALMYTEMKKLTGEIVQAPNSLLNTLFILNMRRSGGLAEPVPITCKFGTTLEQIDNLREMMLTFVKSEKREYQSKIITELRDIPDMHEVMINVVFFYKSNWQNELVRLNRRNKFMCTLMVAVAELGIESPHMRWPGQKVSAPFYMQSASPFVQPTFPGTGASPGPGGLPMQMPPAPAPSIPIHHDAPPGTIPPPPVPAGTPPPPAPPGTTPPADAPLPRRNPSLLGHRKVDFSLGASGMASTDNIADVFDDGRPQKSRLIPLHRVSEEREVDGEDTGRGSTTGANHNSAGSIVSGGGVSRRRTGRSQRSQDSESTNASGRRGWWKRGGKEGDEEAGAALGGSKGDGPAAQGVVAGGLAAAVMATGGLGPGLTVGGQLSPGGLSPMAPGSPVVGPKDEEKRV
ncbi:Mechanosensitive ion channel-domain-containing protein [Pyronema domesticum]|nr:Mechanosensitive ion channel-domain-containing protein [Pyronema domesticum]